VTKQHDLFGDIAPSRVAACAPSGEVTDLAAVLPRILYWGTSTWSFPGWAELVYDRNYSESQLARHGLTAYAQHPLLNAVGLDRGFYAPIPRATLRDYASAVPAEFRFVVKAWAALTTPPELATPPYLERAPRAYLDAAVAVRDVVDPLVEELGPRLGAIVFQFPPQGARVHRAAAFHTALSGLLRGLPRGPVYGIELRDPELLGGDYDALLADNGAVHCCNVHPRMPPVDAQTRAASGPLVVRWMLHPSQPRYEAARERYAPFDRLVDPDTENRKRIARLLNKCIVTGRSAFVIANNKAEGSAPLTLLELARCVRELRAGTGVGR
jgi:uncharacterized protein YecE (DUF72 family)